MAEQQEEGHRRQERIQREQHRPEQNAGYDEAARGGPGVPPSDVGTASDVDRPSGGDAFDREADNAAAEVRRRERT
jgi:hypothetical protein